MQQDSLDTITINTFADDGTEILVRFCVRNLDADMWTIRYVEVDGAPSTWDALDPDERFTALELLFDEVEYRRAVLAGLPADWEDDSDEGDYPYELAFDDDGDDTWCEDDAQWY